MTLTQQCNTKYMIRDKNIVQSACQKILSGTVMYNNINLIVFITCIAYVVRMWPVIDNTHISSADYARDV